MPQILVLDDNIQFFQSNNNDIQDRIELIRDLSRHNIERTREIIQDIQNIVLKREVKQY